MSRFKYILSAPAGLLFCAIAAGLETALAPLNDGVVWRVSSFIIPFLFPWLIAIWAVSDASRRGKSLPYDFDSAVFFIGWFVLPLYLFSTRGVRAFLFLGYALLVLAVYWGTYLIACRVSHFN